MFLAYIYEYTNFEALLIVVKLHNEVYLNFYFKPITTITRFFSFDNCVLVILVTGNSPITRQAS